MSCGSSVMIVEDEMDVRDTLKQILELEGYRVLTAANGKEALNLLKPSLLKEEGEPCLILLDLMMPVMDGWEFLEALQAEGDDLARAIPIVVVSAFANLESVKRQYGCEILQKPVSVPSVVALAQQHC